MSEFDPETFLARLKAQWQAEALNEAATEIEQRHGYMLGTGTPLELRQMATEKRRQAEGDANETHDGGNSLAHRGAHPDDIAVERFAAAMKTKLADARNKGQGGWDDPGQCSAEFLADLLVGHVGKGNIGGLEDIANLAMMLHQRGERPEVVGQALDLLIAEKQAEALESAVRTAKVKRQTAVARWLQHMADNCRLQAEGDANETYDL